MRAYWAQLEMTLRLTFRDRTVLFFNYLFPLIFFFMFAGLYKAKQGGTILLVVTMVLTIGILGAGFFGAGIRAVMDREMNILRRFKVAPISSLPILVSSLAAGLITFVPLVLGVLALAHFFYGMPIPPNWLSLLVFISIGVLAFRGMGMMIASVVNSMAESQIVIQLLYFPMLMLSGATIPLGVLPKWLQIVAQFLPATHLFTGMQSILVAKESLADNWKPAAALLLTTLLSTFLGMKLFRWEKEEKLPASAKGWIAAVLAPFILLGVQQAYQQDNVEKVKAFDRDLRRNRSHLIRGARLVIGDGTVIENGAVLTRNGRIAEVYTGAIPSADELNAEPIEAAGKTLLPGLIDAHVHLGAPGGALEKPEDYSSEKVLPRSLASYLYSGVTAVRTVGDAFDAVMAQRKRIESGQRLGPEIFLSTPMFTVEKGHGTEYFKGLPDQVRMQIEAEMLRLPKSPDEARRMVQDLKKAGAHGVKVILESGQPGMLFARLDVGILNAIAEEARAKGLPVACHTGDLADIRDAIAAGVQSIEHGSAKDRIPDELFAQMKEKGVAFTPTLAVTDAFQQFREGRTDLLERSLVQQVALPQMLAATKKFLTMDPAARARGPLGGYMLDLEVAKDNVRRAWKAGVSLVTGSDAGNMLVIHGPTVQREMQLWVQAGVPAEVALQGATSQAARLLRADTRIGFLRKGYEATLLLVDGNPLKEIEAAERVSAVYFKGERVARPDLFDQD